MVILIGLVTIGALVWLLAWSLTGESDAEHRHMAEMKGPSGTVTPPEAKVPFRRGAQSVETIPPCPPGSLRRCIFRACWYLSALSLCGGGRMRCCVGMDVRV